MPLTIIRDDLANARADAVVLPSNRELVVDGGAGSAVAHVAGRGRLRRACRKAAPVEPGRAAATPAFRFPAKVLVHAVAPVWSGSPGDAELLRAAYDAALALAAEHGCSSVALPLLGAGSFGCPAHVSLSVALRAIEGYLASHDASVTLVLFDKRAVAAGLDLLGDLEQRIDDAYAEAHRPTMSGSRGHGATVEAFDADFGAPSPNALPAVGSGAGVRSARKRQSAADAPASSLGSAPAAPAAAPAAAPDSLEARIEALDQGFSATLLQLIDERGLTDAQVYRRANLTRQHFSKIRTNVGYRPGKATVLALCVALQLDLPQTRDLLARAGFALSHASKFDIVVEYFIERGDFDLFKINEALFYFDQPLLG